MNEEVKERIIRENKNKLDDIGMHTQYKIQYVKEYVESWLRVVTNIAEVKNINFIDCMCNTGLYQNGTWGTPIEVLNLFIEFSKYHKDKTFNLFLNDFDSHRIEIIKELCVGIASKELNNLNIKYSNKDVNVYLKELLKCDMYFGKHDYQKQSTILFVDPYSFGVVKVKNIIDFTNKFYSEVIYNFFSSDYNRNNNNSTAIIKQEQMRDSMEGIYNYYEDMDYKEVKELICKSLKGNYIKYSFPYEFRIKTNMGLYYIIFATPNKEGLVKLKETLWKVFNGDKYFKTQNSNLGQLSIFDSNDVKDMNAQDFSIEAQTLVYDEYKGRTVSFDVIGAYVLEHTMLKEGQIIKFILNPLMSENKVIKNNKRSSRNFKNDSYTFI